MGIPPWGLHLELQPPLLSGNTLLWVKPPSEVSCTILAEEPWQTLCPAESPALAGSQRVLEQALRVTPTHAEV